jgi:hypothetical protein
LDPGSSVHSSCIPASMTIGTIRAPHHHRRAYNDTITQLELPEISRNLAKCTEEERDEIRIGIRKRHPTKSTGSGALTNLTGSVGARYEVAEMRELVKLSCVPATSSDRERRQESRAQTRVEKEESGRRRTKYFSRGARWPRIKNGAPMSTPILASTPTHAHGPRSTACAHHGWLQWTARMGRGVRAPFTGGCTLRGEEVSWKSRLFGGVGRIWGGWALSVDRLLSVGEAGPSGSVVPRPACLFLPF